MWFFMFPVYLLIAAIAIGAVVFWIWMLIDCLTNESSDGNDKLAWTVVIVVLTWIGALIYYFVRRPMRMREFGH